MQRLIPQLRAVYFCAHLYVREEGGKDSNACRSLHRRSQELHWCSDVQSHGRLLGWLQVVLRASIDQLLQTVVHSMQQIPKSGCTASNRR